MAGLVSRFSQVATVCVAVLGVTGILQAVFELGDAANLIDTEFRHVRILSLGRSPSIRVRETADRWSGQAATQARRSYQ